MSFMVSNTIVILLYALGLALLELGKFLSRHAL